MNELFRKIATMTTEQREGALMALDAISRPMTIREIEAAMVGRGVPRTQRKVLSKAVERWHIVALLGPTNQEGGGDLEPYDLRNGNRPRNHAHQKTDPVQPAREETTL
ncbi:MAG: hypothetical protein V4444_04605 [Pseudomonadota bacterium]